MRTTNLIILGLILLAKVSSAQQIPSFEITKNGIAPVVITVDSLSAHALYKKTLHWSHDYYKDRKNYLKAEVANQKINIDGLKRNVWHYTSADITTQYDVEYTLSIDIEDKKIVMSFELGKTWDTTEKGSFSYFIDYRKIWKENGEIHKIYKEAKPGLDQMMNDISHSLVNYLKDYSENESISKKEKLRISKTKS